MPMDKNKMVVGLEKGIQEAMGAAGEEKELIVPDLRVPQIERGVVAANINPSAGLKKWLPYWFITGSVIVLTNHSNTAPKYQLIPPELAVFVVFVCAVCFLFRAMKQVM